MFVFYLMPTRRDLCTPAHLTDFDNERLAESGHGLSVQLLDSIGGALRVHILHTGETETAS